MTRFLSVVSTFVVALSMLIGGNVYADKASQNSYRCMPSLTYGQTDAICVDVVQNGLIGLANATPSIALDRFKHVEVWIDFLGMFELNTEGDTIVNQTDPWFVEDDSSAGAPTLTRVGDADHGVLEMTLASNSEAEYTSLSWNDEQNIDSDRDPIMVARVLVDTMPAAAADSIVIGFASARNDTLDSVANHAWFRIQADSDLMIESDDGTTDDDDNDSTVDVTADAYAEYMIDCTDPTDCDFFHRTTLGGDWTELLPNTAFAIGADTAVQPFIRVEKTSGTAVTSIDIDYVYVTWKRD